MNEPSKCIIAAVTNDLRQDQRMHRICHTLAQAGYKVTLAGRRTPYNIRDSEKNQPAYDRIWLPCRFQKGKLFYLEYNLRLWQYLMRQHFDAVCAVDTDTLPACYLAARLKGKPCVLDAHEYFSEVPELAGRPLEQWIWEAVARLLIPRLKYAYTVSNTLAEALTTRYGICFEVVRNLPLHSATPILNKPDTPYIVLYQGMLNAGRGIEAMLEAMTHLKGVQFWIAGRGDLEKKLRRQAEPLVQAGKVVFHGFVPPEALHQLTRKAHLGINLLEDKGLSYRYSLANKALDYLQAGIPSLQMDFPEYRKLNQQYGVFVCLPDLRPDTIISAIQVLRENPSEYQRLVQNCWKAAQVLHWAEESKTLLQIYQRVFAEPIK